MPALHHKWLFYSPELNAVYNPQIFLTYGLCNWLFSIDFSIYYFIILGYPLPNINIIFPKGCLSKLLHPPQYKLFSMSYLSIIFTIHNSACNSSNTFVKYSGLWKVQQRIYEKFHSNIVNSVNSFRYHWFTDNPVVKYFANLTILSIYIDVLILAFHGNSSYFLYRTHICVLGFALDEVNDGEFPRC